MPPSVYVETSVISLLAARTGRDMVAATHRRLTEEWWNTRRPAFELYVSEIVVAEIRRGDPRAAARRLEFVHDLRALRLDDRVRALSERLVRSAAIPEVARADATHVAVATVHAMDFLLTWNLRHIANAAMRRRIEATCRAAGYEPPTLCTPEELLGESRP